MITKNVEQKVLNKIKSSQNEDLELKGIVSRFLNKLNSSADNLNITCNFRVGGSFGKGTYLKNSFDVDVFCRFDLKYENSDLSELAQKILDNAKIKYFRQKGSRDYFSGNFESIVFELVPNYKINKLDDAQNSTDYSPFHVDFLESRVKENPEILDQIRLTKQLFKAKKLYGAESYINGFSGHVIDILIMYYNSLDNLLNSAKSWGEREIIDVASHYISKGQIEEKIDDSKLSNLILVDPILKDRNAARALLENKYYEFLAFVKTREELSESDFIIKPENSSSFILRNKKFAKENNLDLISYELDLVGVENDDVCGSKLLKIKSKLLNYYKKYDFVSFKSDFYINFKENKCIYLIFFEKVVLSKNKIVKGPQIFRDEAFKNFLGDRKDFFTIEDRVCYYKKRDFTRLNEVESLNLEKFKELSSRDLSFISYLKFTSYE